MDASIDALTAEQVAAALGCEPETLNELAARRKVPAVKYGRSWRFPAAAMNQHLFTQAMAHVQDNAVPTPAANEPTIVVASDTAKRRREKPDLTRAVRVA